MIGVAYIQSMVKTPHRNCISRKNTIAVESINETPITKVKKQMTPNGISKYANVIFWPVMTATKNSGINDNKRLMEVDLSLIHI